MSVKNQQNKEVAEPTKKQCDICRKETNTVGDDVVLFGDWLESNGLRVHYFCLLLSTDLQQRGKDCTGILGFLIRDIRNFSKQVATRICGFCSEPHASISCYKCKFYFHLVCGTAEKCLFVFEGEFISYCNDCLPLTEKQKELQDKPHIDLQRCYICNDIMGPYNPVKWIYGPCCGNGPVHRICVLKYALEAGYYLRCFWCREADKFRTFMRQNGIFVPDRDASWELNLNNYEDLHRGHQRCDMPTCLCPQGRSYVSGKWNLAKCPLCGSFGAHNPICITGQIKARVIVNIFKCETCSASEQAAAKKKSGALLNKQNSELDTSIYLEKTFKEGTEQQLQETPYVEPLNSTSNFVANSLPDLNVDGVSNENTDEELETFETYFFEELNGKLCCKGTGTVCINKKEERFAGKSVDEILQNKLFEDKHIIKRSSDTGVFKVIDEIIKEYANK